MVNWSQHNSHADPSPSSIPRPAAPRFGTSSASLQCSSSRLTVNGTGRSYGYPTWYDRRSDDTASGGNGGSPAVTPSSIPMARSQANRPAQTSSRRLTRTAKQPVSLLPAPTAAPIRPIPGPVSFPGATAPKSSLPRMAGSRSAPLTPTGHPQILSTTEAKSAKTLRPVPTSDAPVARASAPQVPQTRPSSERSSTLRAVEKATAKLSALAMGRPKASIPSGQASGSVIGARGEPAGEHGLGEKRKTLQRQTPVRTVRKLTDLPPSVPLFAVPTVPEHPTSDRALNVPVIIVDQHSPTTGQETRKSSASSAGPATPTESLGLTAQLFTDARSQSTPDLVSPSSRGTEPVGRPVPGRPFSRPVCAAARVEPRNYDLSAFRVEYQCPTASNAEPECCTVGKSKPVVDLVPELTRRHHNQHTPSDPACPARDQSRTSRSRPQKVIPPHDSLDPTRRAVGPLQHLVGLIAALSQQHAPDSATLPTVDEVEEAVEAFVAAERERVFRTGKWDAMARSRASWLLEQLEALLPDVSLKYPVHQAVRRLGISLPEVPPAPAGPETTGSNDAGRPSKAPFTGWSYV